MRLFDFARAFYDHDHREGDSDGASGEAGARFHCDEERAAVRAAERGQHDHGERSDRHTRVGEINVAERLHDGVGEALRTDEVDYRHSHFVKSIRGVGDRDDLVGSGGAAR